MKIKICGLTSPKETDYVNDIEADYIGMVLFFEKSKRNITISQAQEIMNALHPQIKKVAVVVSPALEQVKQIEAAGFDYIQIHGELKNEIINETSIPILRAYNGTSMDLSEYERMSGYERIAGYIFDAVIPGSGQTCDWNAISAIPRDEKLFFLAGGLHAGNVAEAIRHVHPDVVDVSSGVEYGKRPGKDPEKIKAFATAARNA